MIKTFELKYDWWEAVLQIDDTPKAREAMQEQLLFWTGGEDLIDDAENDIVQAYIWQTAPIIIDTSMRKNNTGIINEFKEMEGFLPLDGGCGVKLIESECWEFGHEEFQIRELRNV